MVALVSKLATRRGLIVLLVTYAVVFGTILLTLGQLSDVSGGYGILDFEQGYSPSRVNEILSSYGPEGISLYNRIQILDVFNPALYSFIAAAFTYILWQDRAPAWVCLIPMLGGLGDYAENVTLFLIVRAFPDVPESLVEVSSTLSLIKNGLLLIGMAPLILGVVFWLLRSIQGTSE